MQRNGAREDLTRPKMAMTVGASPTYSAYAMSEKSSGARLLFFANLKSSSIKCADRNLNKKLMTVRAVALPRADTGATLSTNASPGIPRPLVLKTSTLLATAYPVRVDIRAAVCTTVCARAPVPAAPCACASPLPWTRATPTPAPTPRIRKEKHHLHLRARVAGPQARSVCVCVCVRGCSSSVPLPTPTTAVRDCSAPYSPSARDDDDGMRADVSAPHPCAAARSLLAVNVGFGLIVGVAPVSCTISTCALSSSSCPSSPSPSPSRCACRSPSPPSHFASQPSSSREDARLLCDSRAPEIAVAVPVVVLAVVPELALGECVPLQAPAAFFPLLRDSSAPPTELLPARWPRGVGGAVPLVLAVLLPKESPVAVRVAGRGARVAGLYVIEAGRREGVV
ncbi:hypothetical protein C8J57DRAFT_137991 [Mycena rebaudengoi]|nr:hypothetical protein C8J57DRAFT_137991 [Mycena rebaudengoi]